MNPTPEQSLDLLTRATSAVNGNRQDHDNIKIALKVIADLIESLKPKHEDPSH